MARDFLFRLAKRDTNAIYLIHRSGSPCADLQEPRPGRFCGDMDKSFWDFDQASKLDILREEKHLHVIVAALQDSHTRVMKNDHGSFVLYGKEDALLVQACSSPLICLLTILERFHLLLSAKWVA